MKVKTDIAIMKLKHPDHDQPVFEEKLDIISIQKGSLLITHFIITNWKHGRPRDMKTKGHVFQNSYIYLDNFLMVTVINLFDWVTSNLFFSWICKTFRYFVVVFILIFCVYIINWMNRSRKFEHTIGSTCSPGSEIENSQLVDRTM